MTRRAVASAGQVDTYFRNYEVKKKDEKQKKKIKKNAVKQSGRQREPTLQR